MKIIPQEFVTCWEWLQKKHGAKDFGDDTIEIFNELQTMEIPSNEDYGQLLKTTESLIDSIDFNMDLFKGHVYMKHEVAQEFIKSQKFTQSTEEIDEIISYSSGEEREYLTLPKGKEREINFS